MEVTWETHNLVCDVADYEFKEFFEKKLKEIKEKSTDHITPIKEELIDEIMYELEKMKKELWYEEQDFYLQSGYFAEEDEE